MNIHQILGDEQWEHFSEKGVPKKRRIPPADMENQCPPGDPSLCLHQTLNVTAEIH